MYTEFYHLKKCPFHITPDPDFLFLSPSHKQALASIIYGVEEKKGFIAVVGEVGVGKTTILRSYLDSVDKEQTKIIYVFNPDLSFEGILRLLSQELGIDIQSRDTFEIVDALHQRLIEEYREGHNVVFVIDEAQNMPVETLEHLRMLSNLETSTDKLIQIVLLGQPELENILDKFELRQLKQRIAIFSTISPLTEAESYQYIKFRLSHALKVNTPIFTAGAAQEIVRAAKGVPRSINIIADNALITGYGVQRKPVTSKIVREVLADLRAERKTSARWAYVVAGALVLILAVALLAFSDSIFDDVSTTATSQFSKLKNAITLPVPPMPVQGSNPRQHTDSGVGSPSTASAAADIIEGGELRSGIPSSAEKTDPVSKAMQTISVQGNAATEAPTQQDGSNPLQQDQSATATISRPAVSVPDRVDKSADSMIEPQGQTLSPPTSSDPADEVAADQPPPTATGDKGIVQHTTPPEPAQLPQNALQSADLAPNGAAERFQPAEQTASLNLRQPTISRIVKKGDSLIRIAADVYSISVEEVYREGLLDSIIKLNPHIRNINKIEIGQRLILPLIKAQGKATDSAG